MTIDRDAAYLRGLVHELCGLPTETSWVEFKENNGAPDDIGEYLSALSNAAALAGKANGYLVWGVHDADHAIVGTAFDPFKARKGNEELESWLVRLLSPRLHFKFYRVEIDGKPLIILEVPRASNKPAAFSGKELIRVGSVRKPLKEFPEKERELWRLFDQTPFEDGIAADNLSANDALALLDYPSYFSLLDLSLPADQATLLDRLADDRMLVRNGAGSWNITGGFNLEVHHSSPGK